MLVLRISRIDQYRQIIAAAAAAAAAVIGHWRHH
jgi:hypothetical protein